MVQDITATSVHDAWMSAPSVIAHETGQIDIDEFSTRVVEELGLRVSPGEFVADFQTWPSRALPGALELLECIPSNLQVAALSNMSATHWRSVRRFGFEPKFDHVFLSCEIGLLKPDARAYRTVISKLGLYPGEIVFLDDNVDNVQAARRTGLKAYCVRGPKEAAQTLQCMAVL